MRDIRYKQRICTDKNKTDAFLADMRTGTLAVISDGAPYAVPLNYIWLDGALYFHGLTSGRKEEALNSAPVCCFSIYKEYGTVKDVMPCHADTAYFSVIMFGKVILVDDAEEKAAVLQKIVEKYMPGYYKNNLAPEFVKNYKSDHDGKAVHVHKLIVSTITAKENQAEPENLF